MDSETFPQPVTTGWITDGFTRSAYVRERKHQHPAVRFVYRPPLTKERAILRHEAQNCKPDEAEELAARTVCKYVKRWDLRDHQDKPAGLTVHNLLNHVDPDIFAAIANIVLGFRTTDIDPEWTDEATEDARRRNLELVFGKEDAVEMLEMEQGGNSPAG